MIDAVHKLTTYMGHIDVVGQMYYPVAVKEPVFELAEEIVKKIDTKAVGCRPSKLSMRRSRGDYINDDTTNGNIHRHQIFAMGSYTDDNGKRTKLGIFVGQDDETSKYRVFVDIASPSNDVRKEITKQFNDASKKSAWKGYIIDLLGNPLDFGEYNWNNVVLPSSYVQRFEDLLVSPILTPQPYKQFNLRTHKGVILTGLQGMGKTITTKAIANRIKGHGTFIYTTVDQLPETVFHSAIIPDFEYAIQVAELHQPSILCLEGFEALPVNEMILNYLDGGMKRGDVHILGVTNSPEEIDQRYRARPGRIDWIANFDPRNVAEFNMNWKAKIIETHLHRENVVNGIEIRDLRQMKSIFTGDELRDIAEEATAKALRRMDIKKPLPTNTKVIVTKEDFEHAFNFRHEQEHRAPNPPYLV